MAVLFFFPQDGRGQLAPAVRRVADSCRSHSTASSSTLPHCHCQHRRWGGVGGGGGGSSRHRKSDFPPVFSLTWSGRCLLLSAQSPTGVLMLPFKSKRQELIQSDAYLFSFVAPFFSRGRIFGCVPFKALFMLKVQQGIILWRLCHVFTLWSGCSVAAAATTGYYWCF